MRRLAALLLPVLALSACVAPGYGPYSGGGRYSSRSSDRWYDDTSIPLAARIVPDGSWFGIQLNRPAYVAVFEILPGRGVAMVYPTYGREDAFFPHGYSALRTPNARRYDWYDVSYSGRYQGSEPRFYFLVASRRPLRVSRFERSPGSLRSVLGYSAYSTLNYRTVMNDLVNVIVPPQSEDDWTTDVYAQWPNSYPDRYAYDQGRYVRVDCGGGVVDVVPWELYRFACRSVRQHTGQQTTGHTAPPPRSDTTRVTTPGRHRPEPRDSVGGGTVTNPATEGARTPERRVEPRREMPRMRDDDRPRVDNGSDSERPQAEPRSAEPRREAPRREEPPVESPRSEPRSESPRTEPRSEPRHEAPRAEPRYEAPPPPPPPPPPQPSPPPASEPSRSEPTHAPSTSRPVPSERR